MSILSVNPQPIPSQFDAKTLAITLAARLAGRSADGSRASFAGSTSLLEIIWVDAGDEVLVHLENVAVSIVDQTLLVSVDLETDQTGRSSLIVPFALGAAGDFAGLVAVTDELPRGNGLLAARWGPILQAALWSAILGLAQDHAAQTNMVPRNMAIQNNLFTLQPGPALQTPQASTAPTAPPGAKK